MRILVALEDEYRAFRDAIVFAFQTLRPGDAIEAVELSAIGESLTRFDPHLVIAGVPNAFDPEGRTAWVELSPDPDRPSRVRVGGQSSEAYNPSIEDLVAAAEETEGLIGNEPHLRGC